MLRCVSFSDRVKSAGTVIISVLVFLIVLFWLVILSQRLGKAPVYGENGEVQVDEFARAKDIFVLVLPLLTTAVGFWLGNQGTVKAEAQAASAAEQAASAEAKTQSVLAEAPPGLLAAARNSYPEAWQ